MCRPQILYTNAQIIDWMVDEFEQLSEGDVSKEAGFTGKSIERWRQFRARRRYWPKRCDWQSGAA